MWSHLGKSIFVCEGCHFPRRDNQYTIIKDGKEYAINAHKDKVNLSLINAHQTRRIMGSTKKFVLLFLIRKVARRRQGVGD